MLMRQEQPDEAAGVLARHAAPAQAEHFGLYEAVACAALAAACRDPAHADTPAMLACHRFLRELLQALRRRQAVQDAGFQAMQAAWHAVHLSVLHARCIREGWHDMAARQATSMLRHIQLLPADAAYASAGTCRVHEP